MAVFTNKEIEVRLAKALDAPADRGHAFLDAFGAAVPAALLEGEVVPLPGLGRFLPQDAQGQVMPATGVAEIEVRLTRHGFAEGPETAKLWFHALAGQIRALLLDRNEVRIEPLGAWSLILEPPHLERHARGHRLIRPAVSEIRFLPAGEGGPRAGFEAEEEITRRLGAVKSSEILILVPDQDPFADTLRHYFQQSGWGAFIVTNVYDALSKLDRGGAFLALVDAGLKDAQQFCSALKCRRETSLIPLVLMFPDIQRLAHPSELVVVGDENIVEPFEIRALMDVVDAEIVRAAEERLIFEQMVHLHLPTEDPALDACLERVGQLLTISGLAEEGQVAMSSAVKEALRNAADHGNKSRRDKKIEVQYLLDRERVTVSVRDYGEGFDHSRFIRRSETGTPVALARERRQEGRLGGLGILLMLKCTDSLEYNDVGNRVTLVKRLPYAADGVPAPA